MTIKTQALIDQRPHLKEPLEFYDKCQLFLEKVADYLSSNESTSLLDTAGTYPKKSIAPILNHFARTFNLPHEELEPLKKALEDGEINFLELPLKKDMDTPFINGDDDKTTALFLLSRPFFKALRNTSLMDGNQWKNGLCPLCSAHPVISTIKEGPKRILHCSYCGTSGPYEFIGCPNCGTTDASMLGTLSSDQEPGFRISTCSGCHSYVKVIDYSLFNEMTPDIADIASLPLDIIAQSEGYSRNAPNPLGLQKIE